MKKLILTSIFLAGCVAHNYGQASLSTVAGTIQEANKSLQTLRATEADTAKAWKTGGVIGINFSQASFTNWAAGGQNSLSLNAMASVFASYKKGNSAWDNTLALGYGFIQQGKNKSLIKTDDKIDFSSKYGQKASKNWYYTGLLNFKTQSSPGYNYPNDSVKISDFLAPAYLLAALGMDFKPSDHFSAFLAPATYKMTIVNNQALADAGAYGVEKATYDNTGMLLTSGKMIRSEFGGYAKIMFKHDIFSDKSVSFLSTLEMFSNYQHNPQNIDVNWETVIGFKVNKFISATVSASLVYDDDINIAIDNNNDGIVDAVGPRTQFKEVIGIGLNYKF